ncbi:MAG: phosphoribosylformylglycinamidine synthase subunit PurS [Chloroflexi bacterium]|nr:phosphoribosylformylglycinamidine synthase subunit PurS [Chloroflexota bacterium]
MFLAKVYVTLKPTVNDPQGKTILGGLKSLGFDQATEVRAGKYLEIKVDATERAEAEATVEEMCRKLLANPVIEGYRYEVDEILL